MAAHSWLKLFLAFFRLRFDEENGQDRRCDLTSYNLRENEYKLAVPQPRTEFYKRSLSYSGSVLWNGLPLEVRQLTSPSIFKGKLRDINFD